MWIARDEDDTLYLYAKKPTMESRSWGRFYNAPNNRWLQIPKSWFPNFKFEDGPKRIKKFDRFSMGI